MLGPLIYAKPHKNSKHDWSLDVVVVAVLAIKVEDSLRCSLEGPQVFEEYPGKSHSPGLRNMSAQLAS